MKTTVISVVLASVALVAMGCGKGFEAVKPLPKGEGTVFGGGPNSGKMPIDFELDVLKMRQVFRAVSVKSENRVHVVRAIVAFDHKNIFEFQTQFNELSDAKVQVARQADIVGYNLAANTAYDSSLDAIQIQAECRNNCLLVSVRLSVNLATFKDKASYEDIMSDRFEFEMVDLRAPYVFRYAEDGRTGAKEMNYELVLEEVRAEIALRELEAGANENTGEDAGENETPAEVGGDSASVNDGESNDSGMAGEIRGEVSLDGVASTEYLNPALVNRKSVGDRRTSVESQWDGRDIMGEESMKGTSDAADAADGDASGVDKGDNGNGAAQAEASADESSANAAAEAVDASEADQLINLQNPSLEDTRFLYQSLLGI